MGALVQENFTAKAPFHFIINTSKAFVNLVGRVSLSLIFITGDTGSQSRRKRIAGIGESAPQSFALTSRREREGMKGGESGYPASR